MRWVENVAYVGEKRNGDTVSLRKPNLGLNGIVILKMVLKN
jgi:hypothetical protein